MCVCVCVSYLPSLNKERKLAQVEEQRTEEYFARGKKRLSAAGVVTDDTTPHHTEVFT